MGRLPQISAVKTSPGRSVDSAFVILASSLLVAAIAITNQSLWIDEANAALKAVQPTLGDWWQTLAREKGSDLQMPLYMFYLWAWEKIAGHSEVALRAANVPFLLLAHWGLFRAARRSPGNGWPLVVLASVNPFLWFYLNEARPYVMQYAGSCLVICALSEFLYRHERRDSVVLWWFAVGTILLGGSSMLGMAWAGCAILALGFVCMSRREWPNGVRDLAPIAVTFAMLAALSLFYLWTLRQGAGGSIGGKLSLANIFFVPYELLGFSGLGPGRLELREGGPALLRNYVVPLAALAAALFISTVAAGRVLLQRSNRPALFAGAIYALPPALFVVGLGFALNFRFLGRHFTPLSAVVVVLMAVGVARFWTARWRIIAFVLPLLWLTSALLIRWAPRHEKDDYRGAAAIARQAASDGKIVWWAADVAAARYYGLTSNEVTPRGVTPVVNVANLSGEQLETSRQPDVVLASKPDIYDVSGALADYLAKQNFKPARQLPAFTVWERR
jgi:hypothetical protein